MPVETWLIFIISFMILGSIVALELKDLLSAIISIGVVGLGVSIAFIIFLRSSVCKALYSKNKSVGLFAILCKARE